ncbi:alpha-hydroxy-acid oxidizing protein, partial [Pseudomonas aeruginosa]
AYRGNPTGLEDYIGWLGANFDPSISWKDLEWIREFWDGPMVIKGILDPEDARDAVKFGADSVLLGRAFVYALAAAGEAGVRNLLELIEKEMRVAMVLTGAKSIGEISADSLVRELGA